MNAQRQASSLTHDLLYATRYYIWRPRVLVTLAAIAIVTGLALNWSWLVAAGLAPLLISTLPCLVMCAFGVCMLCRSGQKHSALARDPAGSEGAPTTLTVSVTDKQSTGMDGCCLDSRKETKLEQTIDMQPNRERRDTHA